MDNNDRAAPPSYVRDEDDEEDEDEEDEGPVVGALLSRPHIKLQLMSMKVSGVPVSLIRDVSTADLRLLLPFTGLFF